MGWYLEGIEGAAEDEEAVVAQRSHHSQVVGVADEVDLADAGVVVDHLEDSNPHIIGNREARGVTVQAEDTHRTQYLGRLHKEEGHDDAQLQQDEEEGYDELSARRHEARFLGADLLLAARQDPGDAVGLQIHCDFYP